MKLRFTIRDLFWLVLVAALAVGWWCNRFSLIKNYGQYTLTKTGWKKSDASTQVDYLIDTSTGRSWLRIGDNWNATTDFVRQKSPAPYWPLPQTVSSLKTP